MTLSFECCKIIATLLPLLFPLPCRATALGDPYSENGPPVAKNETEAKLYLGQLDRIEKAMPGSKEETMDLMYWLEHFCDVLRNVTPETDGYCPYYFDRIICWRPTPVNAAAYHSCPRYIKGFHYASNVDVEMRCMENGRWNYTPSEEAFYKIYGRCKMSGNESRIDDRVKWYREIILQARAIGAVGYAISMCSLLVASGVFIFFKRLHCSRNFIHLHLFLAFTLRAFMCVLFHNLFVNEKSLQLDGPVKNGNGSDIEIFENPGPHWECKLFMTIWNYALVASYFWLLIEASYLHNAVYFFVFRETKVTYYVIFGWAASLLVMVPWVIVKIFKDNYLCWVSYLNLNYLWIQRGPIMFVIVKIFLLFINIIRELFVKLRDSHITEASRYRKLAKSSFVLIVLLGIDYFVFSIPMLVLDTHNLTLGLAICLSLEQILSSLQGFFVALVYCFTNTEVRMEVRKRWKRWRLYRNLASSCQNGVNGANNATALSLLQSPAKTRDRRLSSKSSRNGDASKSGHRGRISGSSLRKWFGKAPADPAPIPVVRFSLDSACPTACSTVASSPYASSTRVALRAPNDERAHQPTQGRNLLAVSVSVDGQQRRSLMLYVPTPQKRRPSATDETATTKLAVTSPSHERPSSAVM